MKNKLLKIGFSLCIVMSLLYFDVAFSRGSSGSDLILKNVRAIAQATPTEAKTCYAVVNICEPDDENCSDKYRCHTSGCQSVNVESYSTASTCQ